MPISKETTVWSPPKIKRFERKKRNPLESAIQRKIIKKLEKAGWFVLKIITSNKNGINDLIAFKNKKAVFIEVKRPGKEADELQKYRHEQLRKEGFAVIVADNVEAVAILCE